MILVKRLMEPLIFKPLTSQEWPDFVQLFQEHGVQRGCWCMYWRITRADFHRQYGEGNQRAIQQIVKAGPPPGILAYLDEQPVGWCSIAPRSSMLLWNGRQH